MRPLTLKSTVKAKLETTCFISAISNPTILDISHIPKEKNSLFESQEQKILGNIRLHKKIVKNYRKSSPASSNMMNYQLGSIASQICLAAYPLAGKLFAYLVPEIKKIYNKDE